MRQYTTPDQTAKLIELGFEKPKGLADAEPSSGKWVRPAYSIGELIEMLPDIINILHHAILKMETTGLKWHVKYEGDRGLEFLTYNTQLIDALYYMVVKLKEDGVI